MSRYKVTELEPRQGEDGKRYGVLDTHRDEIVTVYRFADKANAQMIANCRNTAYAIEKERR